MQPPEKFRAILDGKRYSTATATLLAGNNWWDGHNYERSGTNQFLYRTPKGAYFFVHLSQWQGAHNSIAPCTEEEAREFYESLPEHVQVVDYEEAFPDAVIEEA
jgi:hypothetical protein